MIERYLTGRETLKKAVMLCDIRREPSARDVQMYAWLSHYGMDGLIAATKADKISRSMVPRSVEAIRSGLGAGPEAKIVPVSALKKTGVSELLAEVERVVQS
jgi:GTP-binding protein